MTRANETMIHEMIRAEVDPVADPELGEPSIEPSGIGDRIGVENPGLSSLPSPNGPNVHIWTS